MVKDLKNIVNDLFDRIGEISHGIKYGPKVEMDEVAEALKEYGLKVDDLNLFSLFNEDLTRKDSENPYVSPSGNGAVRFEEVDRDNFIDYVRGLKIDDLDGLRVSGEYFVRVEHYEKDKNGEWMPGCLFHKGFDRIFYINESENLKGMEFA